MKKNKFSVGNIENYLIIPRFFAKKNRPFSEIETHISSLSLNQTNGLSIQQNHDDAILENDKNQEIEQKQPKRTKPIHNFFKQKKKIRWLKETKEFLSQIENSLVAYGSSLMESNKSFQPQQKNEIICCLMFGNTANTAKEFYILRLIMFNFFFPFEKNSEFLIIFFKFREKPSVQGLTTNKELVLRKVMRAFISETNESFVSFLPLSFLFFLFCFFSPKKYQKIIEKFVSRKNKNQISLVCSK